MIINIDDTQKLKRVIIEFSDTEEEIDFKTVTKSNTSKPKKSETVTESNTSKEKPINFDEFLDSKTDNELQEVIEKPKIPEVKDRKPKVSNNMQNLVL